MSFALFVLVMSAVGIVHHSDASVVPLWAQAHALSTFTAWYVRHTTSLLLLLALDSQNAVAFGAVVWTTMHAHPGITSDVVITFDTTAAVPVGGQLLVTLPPQDFTAPAGPLTATLSTPDVPIDACVWDAQSQTILVTLGGAVGIDALATGVLLAVAALDAPLSVRVASRGGALFTTVDAQSNVLDGPIAIEMDAITPGLVLGARTWVATTPVAAITSDQTLTFFSSGALVGGSIVVLTLPDVQWFLAATTGTATVSTSINAAPPISAAVTFDDATRVLSITLPQFAITIPASSIVTIVVHDVRNPPKATGVCNGDLVTFAPDGNVIDGPGTISFMAIRVGSISGHKTWTAMTTTSASRTSDYELRVTLSGALPSGSFCIIQLPIGVGWRFASTATRTATFTLPATGVRVASLAWREDTATLRIETQGDLPEYATLELVVYDLVNPFHEQQATTLALTTALADTGVVDTAVDITMHAIERSVLALDALWASSVATPGVASLQVLALTVDGSLEDGARICVSFVASDGWTLASDAEATMQIDDRSGGVTASMHVDWTWSDVDRTLCITTVAAVAQQCRVEVAITKMRSPPSERASQHLPITLTSHLGGVVSTGIVALHAITRGALAGALTWQSAWIDPGPVAGLETTATLAFQTTGRLLQGSNIVLTLPIEWQFDSNCAVVFDAPIVAGGTVCASNVLTVLLSDAIDDATDVVLRVVRGVHNPPSVQPPGVALLQTVAADARLVDESAAITTNAINAALTAITSSGDVRTAVAGVAKTFAFGGASVGESDVLKFVDASTTRDANCGAAVRGVSDAGGLDIATLSNAHTATLTFTQASLDTAPFALCYKFGANPFRLYTTLRFTVKAVLAVTATVGVPHVAVANAAKTWHFTGRGIAAAAASSNDHVRWIRQSVVDAAAQTSVSLDCSDTSTLATLVTPSGAPLAADEDAFTRNVASTGVATFIFDRTLAGETFSLCYQFGSEPFTVYPQFTVHVHDVVAIEATVAGSDDVAVVDAAKQFRFVGSGVRSNDRVYFIEAGSATSCAPSSTDAALRIEHLFANQLATVLFIDADVATTVQFTAAAAGKRVLPCYQFATESFQLYPLIVLEIKMVRRFLGALGSPLLAVASVPEPLTFVGYGLGSGDHVRWLWRRDDDCESNNVAALLDLITFEPIDTIVLDAALAGAFLFTETQVDYNPVLCYKFGSEPFQRYATLTIAIGTIRSKVAATGDRSVAVVASRKVLTLVGSNVAANDRVAWTTHAGANANCESLALLVQDPLAPDDDYVSYTNVRNEVRVAFAPINSGKRVYLCYGFGTEPFKLYAHLYLDVKSVVAMRALVGSSRAAVAGARKSFLFDGDGVASGDEAKFVVRDINDAGAFGTDAVPTSCDAPGVTLRNILKEFDNYNEMAMFVYENVPGVAVGSFEFASDAATAGAARVLCYRFGIEPFAAYDAFTVDIYTIWRLQRFDLTSGQDDVAVVNERKLMKIDGVGMSDRDVAKFVDATAATNDQDCTDLPALGVAGQSAADNSVVHVFRNASLWFAFEDASKNDAAWLLCYKFDDEPFRLYRNVTVRVKQVLDVVDADDRSIPSLGRVATIGRVKRWQPRGTGIQVGDTAKLVAQSVQTSADCGVGNANVAGGTTLMRVTSSAGSNDATELVFAGVMTTFPSSRSDVYHLCYKFQDEPFALVRGFVVQTYGVLNIDRSVVLAQASTPLQLSGYRLASTDRVGWTTSATTCNDNSMLATITDVTDQTTTTVVFDVPYTKLYLCYSFDRQPFTHFVGITLTVAAADVWVPQTTSVVADQDVQLRVAGSFGLTVSNDELAWVPLAAVSCANDVRTAVASVMVTSVVSTTPLDSPLARSGAAVFRVRFVRAAAMAAAANEGLSSLARFASWKLCYRFGNTPTFLLFSDVVCDVLTIESATLVASEPSDRGRTELAFAFTGVGLQDVDAAKWIDADAAAAAATQDAVCTTLPAVGGSAATVVVNQRARFVFEDATPRLALCYQFHGHAFQLFADVPIHDAVMMTPATAASNRGDADSVVGATQSLLAAFADEREAMSSGALTLNRDVAAVTLTLARDYATLLPRGSLADVRFQAAFTAAIATSLRIDATRIRIVDVTEGSVVVHLELLPSDNTADRLVHEAVADLQQQLLDPQSLLRKEHDVIAAVDDPLTALRVTLTTPPLLSIAPSTASTMSLHARSYQRNGLFTFVRSVYSVTEASRQVTVPVLRLQGADAAVTLTVRIDAAKRTAAPSVNYKLPDGLATTISASGNVLLLLRFAAGERLQHIVLDILDDGVVREAHFSFLTLALEAPDTVADAAIGGAASTVVRIYAYDAVGPNNDDHANAERKALLVHHHFPFSESDSASDDRHKLQGWRIDGNGESATLRVDASGLFGVDAVVGDREYDERCDKAAPASECAFACSSSSSADDTSSSDSRNDDAAHSDLVLEVGDDDFVVSQSAIRGFPTEALTLSLWVKTTQRTATACLASYAVLPLPSDASGLSYSSSATIAFALCNPSSLELLLNARYDTPSAYQLYKKRRSDRLATFVDVSDGAWHALVVSWSAADGRVRVFDNGMLAFDGGPFRISVSLVASTPSPAATSSNGGSRGFFVVGGVIASNAQTSCSSERKDGSSSSNTDSMANAPCALAPGSSFRGRVQLVTVYARVLQRADVLKQLARPPQVATSRLVFGWRFDAPNVVESGRSVRDFAVTGQAQPTIGTIHCTRSTATAVAVSADSSSEALATSPCFVAGDAPSISPTFPCGRVYANLWHFVAPDAIVQQLRRAYGGRLQFELLAPSHNGAPRARRGQLTVADRTGHLTMSLALGAFALPSSTRWTHYVAVLREDYGWVREPSGVSIPTDAFQQLLIDAGKLTIRGDLWGPDASGLGQEVVYLNNVAVYARV